MSDKDKWVGDFVGDLQRLADHGKPDRATLAELRRCLGGDLGRALHRVGWLFSRVPDFALDDALLVAGLFASHQGHAAGFGLGKAFRDLKDRTGSDSVEKRFVALLDSDREDLGGRLRQAVSLLRSKDIPLDWGQLLTDLRGWAWPSRRVQREWARAFWEERRAEPPSAEAAHEPQRTA
jgi:CRISPR system Cascade subunit CasB